MATSQRDGEEYATVMPEATYLMDSAEEDNAHSINEDDEMDNPDQIRDQDRFLPIANVAKIMKDSIPSNGKIAKDAKECVQECVSEFVSFVTSEAADRCQQEKRKTINGEDLLFAMSTLGFDSYVEPLKIFLSKYRDSLKTEKSGLGGVAEIEDGMVQMGADHSSNAAYVRAPQTVNIIHDGRESGHVTHQLATTQHHHLQAQNIYTAAYPGQGDMHQQIHYQS
jgi:histone H3/H4